MTFEYPGLAKMIDHSLLSPALTVTGLEHGCRVARAYDVASVCMLPYFLARGAALLAGSTVKAGTTVGFPHGGHTTATKVAEAERALADGAEELDMVINISQGVSGGWAYVRDDIDAVLRVTHAAGQKLKVIFENAYLDADQKVRLCEICGELGVDWIKTSTGYAPSGATIDDLKLMRAHTPTHVQLKAAGGVRTLDQLLEVRALGVTRCGASRTVEILEEARRRLGLPPITAPATVASPGY